MNMQFGKATGFKKAEYKHCIIILLIKQNNFNKHLKN